MSLRIQLDKAQGAFTNLDQISGVVILSILGPETISAITVKLEGESRSHLAGTINPRRNYDGFEKEGSRHEIHKVCRINGQHLTKHLVLIILIASLQGPHRLPYTRAPAGHRPGPGLYPTFRPSFLSVSVQGMLRAVEKIYQSLI